MPNVELKETNGCTTKLHIVIEKERVEQEVQTTLASVKKDVVIPGFRKGRAPESMILQRFAGTIREEALKTLVPSVVHEAIEERGLKRVGEPELSELEFAEDGSLSFDVAIEQAPEIDVTGFEKLPVTREVIGVTDTDVDGEIERVRHYQSRQTDVERGAQANDIIVCNLQKLDASGVPIIGETLKDHVVALDGKTTPSPEFDAQVFGMTVGEKRTVTFTYDESIGNPELVGTTESYEVGITRVMENVVPELDDEFLKMVGFETLDAFRGAVRARITAQIDSRADAKLRRDIIEEFIKQHPFEVPASMVSRVIEGEVARAKQHYTQQGEAFDEEAFRAQVNADAVRSVQTLFIIEAVRTGQNIEATKEDVDAYIEASAAMSGSKPRELKRRLIKENRYNAIKDDLVENKVYEWLFNAADVTTKTVERPSAESPIA